MRRFPELQRTDLAGGGKGSGKGRCTDARERVDHQPLAKATIRARMPPPITVTPIPTIQGFSATAGGEMPFWGAAALTPFPLDPHGAREPLRTAPQTRDLARGFDSSVRSSTGIRWRPAIPEPGGFGVLPPT
jgi:hypothetical protein